MLNDSFVWMALSIMAAALMLVGLWLRTRHEVRLLRRDVDGLREQLRQRPAQMAEIVATVEATSRDVALLAEAHRVAVRMTGDREVSLPFSDSREPQ